LKHENDQAINASFLTLANLNWWLYICMNYLPPREKRLMFLPCAGAFKTRNQDDGRKFISRSTSHQFMKAIREDLQNENIILSEPLTLIPYALEASTDPLRPDYNLPVTLLSIQQEFIFIERVALWLLKIKNTQPDREVIYYFGGSHHYFILHYANKFAGSPFEIIFHVPKAGTAAFGRESKTFMEQIHFMESAHQYQVPPPLPIENELKKRAGRYTHKPFLLALIEAERLGHSFSETQEHRIEVGSKTDFQAGFERFYGRIIPVNSISIKW
jgi:hypothetical protein